MHINTVNWSGIFIGHELRCVSKPGDIGRFLSRWHNVTPCLSRLSLSCVTRQKPSRYIFLTVNHTSSNLFACCSGGLVYIHINTVNLSVAFRLIVPHLEAFSRYMQSVPELCISVWEHNIPQPACSSTPRATAILSSSAARLVSKPYQMENSQALISLTNRWTPFSP